MPEKISFEVPTSVLEQEISQLLNNQVRTMSEDELNALKEDQAKIEKMREEANNSEQRLIEENLRLQHTILVL